jgi:hypothetical protein
MAIDRRYDGAGRSRGRGRLMKVTSLALGIAMFGTVGMSGTLAQDDPGAGTTDAESMVENIISEIFGELFGGGGVDDDAAVSGGDLNIGGSSGSTVTMGGSGGSVTMGGGVTVGDNYGG